MVLESLCKEIGVSQSWGRIFHLYGPHEHAQRFVPTIIKGLLQKNDVPCSHGEQIRDFLHVYDVADAFAALLESSVEGVVNIGSGQGIALKHVIHKIAERMGGIDRIQFGALSAPKNDPASLVPDTTRLRQELGWRPQFDLEHGLADAISWWESKL
jgi:nucleoside-diphosphate-sugar epimerase